MYADIARLDVTATRGPVAPFTGGYDNILRTPRSRATGVETTQYMAPIQLECQVETEYDPTEMLDVKNLGDENTTEIKLCFHFQDLEDNGFVDSNGKAVMPKGSKLLRIFDQHYSLLDDYEAMNLVSMQPQPRSYGLSGGFRNLLLVSFRRDTKATV
jgi:hypothetical protein